MFSSLLSPIHLGEKDMPKNSFFNVIHHDRSTFGGFRGPGIAFVGSTSSLSEKVRAVLQKLPSHFNNIQVYDLGVMSDMTIENIETVSDQCLSHGIIPVYIGYEFFKNISTHNTQSDKYRVSNTIDNQVPNINYIGYQRHLCTLDSVFKAENVLFNSLSLGKMRSFPSLIEPVLRDVDQIFVDLNAVRSSDSPSTKGTYPTGLHAEELCQILKHVGTGTKIQAVYFDFDILSEPTYTEACLLAEAIWYFTEGVNIRVNDHPDRSSDHTKFINHSSLMDEDLEFYKHNQTSRLWLKHEIENGNIEYLACSFDEYQASIGEDMPERLYKFLHRT